MIGRWEKSRPGRWPVRRLGLLLAVLLVLLGAGVYAGRKAWAGHYLRAAQRALECGDFDQARANLALYLDTWPDNAEAHLLAARAARRGAPSAPAGEGWYQDAERHLKECRRLGGREEAVELERALLRAQQGDLAGVEEYLLGCLGREHPDTPLILEALLQGYVSTYQLPRALGCANLLLQHQPDNPQALFRRGLVRELLFAGGEAIPDYRRVVELDPENDPARLRLAQNLLKINQLAEAEEQFRHLRDRQPGDGEVLLGLAQCWQGQGRPQEAKQLLAAVLTRQPNNGPALLERGRAELALGQLAEAEETLRRALVLAPHEPQAFYSLSVCLQQRGRKEEAKHYRAAYERIRADWRRLRTLMHELADAPRDPGLRYEAGVLYLRNGQEQDGLGWFASALRLDPGHPGVHQALANYYEQKGRPDLATRHRQQALPRLLQVLGTCLAGILP